MKNQKVLIIILFGFFFGCLPVRAEQFPSIVEARNRSVLAAEWEGVLTAFKADAGDNVKKGAVLAEIFHRDIVFKKQKHRATRKYYKVQVDNLTKLNEKGLVPVEELEKARMEQAVNEAEIKIIDTEIARAKIRAPFSGLVVSRHIQPYEWVRPGQPVVEIYDPDKLRIVADIPSEKVVILRKGQKDSFRFPDLDKTVEAELDVIFPQVDVRSNTVKIYWNVPASALKDVQLIPGMKGELTLGSE
ncbi:MAG: efflux RND transporter periplasmic adaptor subunit [Desulfococcaceae bacterium]|nr:efflux RND transporter periplasmic adaptor subunit [Desulfococcaceae bacterium]